MDKIFDNIEDEPLSDQYIHSIIPDVPILIYDDLKYILNIDDILTSGACIILYQVKKNIGHWICILKHNTKYEYFDSYGRPIDYYIKKGLNKTPYLTRLLKGKNKIYNKYRYQEDSPDISTCGRHVITRCLLRNIQLTEYKKIFKNQKKIQSDDLVAYITELIKPN